VAEDFSFAGDRVAAAWERYRDRLFQWSAPLSTWMVNTVDPKPGETVLEVAAGPGETGFLAAERLGPEGKLISTDLNEAMVDAARRGAETRRLTNVECRVMDGQQMDLPDDSVDGVLSRFAIMLMPEPDRAVAEIRRVLRPGGRLAYGVWGPFDRNGWLTHLVGALLQHGVAPPGDPFGPGGPFSLPDAQKNRELATGAGFTDVEVVEFEGTMEYADLDDYFTVQTAVSGPVSGLVAAMSEDEKAQIKETLAEMTASFRTDTGGYRFPTLSLGVTAA
jgi:SAM-dependent methyltransferase